MNGVRPIGRCRSNKVRAVLPLPKAAALRKKPGEIQMKKTSVALLTATTIAALFTASSTFAAQNAASTSQKGSLLIWPKISIDANVDTIVEISNDANASVHVECEYVNEAKGRTDFGIDLTAKATASWDVRKLAGDPATFHPPPFPTNVGGGPPYSGPRTPAAASGCCFATNLRRFGSRSRGMN